MHIQKLFLEHVTDVFAFPFVLSIPFLLLFTNPAISLDDEKIIFCKVRTNKNFLFRLSIEIFWQTAHISEAVSVDKLEIATS